MGRAVTTDGAMDELSVGCLVVLGMRCVVDGGFGEEYLAMGGSVSADSEIREV